MRASIVVPAHVSGPLFDRCLASIRALSPLPDEVIIVDDSADGCCAVAARAAGFTVTHTSGRRGPAVARNMGAACARGDVLLFFDADVAVPRDAVARVASHFSRSPDLAAVIGSYDRAPGDDGFMSQYKNLVHRYIHQTADEDASTFWGACGAVRLSAFLAVGGFDERYTKASIEDIEFGYRLRAAGYTIRLDRTFEVTHLKRWTPASVIVSDVRDRAVPWTKLAAERGGLPRDLNLRTASRIAAGLVWLTAATAMTAFLVPDVWPFVFVPLGALIIIDAGLWRYLGSLRGPSFAIRAMAWHWFYYAYSSATYVSVMLTSRMRS